MRKRNSKGLSDLELVCVLGVALAALAAAVPLYRQVSNSLAVDADHNNIRQAYALLSQARLFDTSPEDGSPLPTEGEPITFYYLTGGLCQREGDKYHAVPERAYVLSGSDGPRGHDCDLRSAGAIHPGPADVPAMEAGTFAFCGAHLKGNHIKLVYDPGGAQGQGRWLLALEE